MKFWMVLALLILPISGFCNQSDMLWQVLFLGDYSLGQKMLLLEDENDFDEKIFNKMKYAYLMYRYNRIYNNGDLSCMQKYLDDIDFAIQERFKRSYFD